MKYRYYAAALAASLLIPLADSALASQVTLYGLLDYGIRYRHSSVPFTGKTTSTVSMVSGERNGSRWGLKGTEELGSGTKIGFMLESGFDDTTGQSLQGGRLFGRGAFIYLDTPYGSIKGGRMGGFNSPNDSYLNLARLASPWGGGTIGGAHAALYYNSYEDNVLEVKTPDLKGLTLYGHYSFNTNGDEATKNRNNNRVLAFGLSYVRGPLEVRASYEKSFWSRLTKRKDTDAYTLAARYSANPINFYFGTQWVNNVPSFNAVSVPATLGATLSNYQEFINPTANVDRGMTGWGVVGGTAYEIGQLKLILMGARTDYRVVGTSDHLAFWTASTGAEYKISKETGLYGVLGYAKGNQKLNKLKDLQAVVGVRHWF